LYNLIVAWFLKSGLLGFGGAPYMSEFFRARRFLSLLLAISLLFIFAHTERLPADTLDEQPVDPVIIRHRERIQPVINNLRNESFDDLLRNLNLDEGYIPPVHLTYKKFPQIDTEVVYSNRRVLRLLSLLQDMPRAEAAEKCKAIFESAFSVFKDTAEAGLKMWQDPDAPKNEQSMLGNKWALSASLILSSRFCDAETVLARIEAVDQFNAELTRRFEDSPNLLPGSGICLMILELSHYLQPRVKFQALADAIIADKSIDDSEIIEYLSKIPTKKILLTPWDAEITSFDFVHRTLVAPIDKSKGVTPLILYYEDINLADFYFIRDRLKEELQKELGKISEEILAEATTGTLKDATSQKSPLSIAGEENPELFDKEIQAAQKGCLPYKSLKTFPNLKYRKKG